MAVKKIRYATVPVISLELITSMSAEDNALFNRIIFSCFQQLENGEKPSYEPVNNPVLGIALREAVAEVEQGYYVYVERVENGGKGGRPPKEKPEDNQRFLDENQRFLDENQRVTRAEPKEENRREEKEGKEKENEGNTYHQPSPLRITEAERAEIESRLSDFGIEPDAGFWNTCFLYGYKAVCDALNKAEETESYNLKYITGLIRKGT